ncbi:MAG: hypothetical protein ACKN9V_06165, partial [Pseudomonadota bacterium]
KNERTAIIKVIEDFKLDDKERKGIAEKILSPFQDKKVLAKLKADPLKREKLRESLVKIGCSSDEAKELVTEITSQGVTPKVMTIVDSALQRPPVFRQPPSGILDLITSGIEYDRQVRVGTLRFLGPGNITIGDVVSLRLRSSGEIITGRILKDKGHAFARGATIRIDQNPQGGGPFIIVSERDILSLRKGKSVPSLHDIGPSDWVRLDGKVGRILGYSPDGTEIIFVEARKTEQEAIKIPSSKANTVRKIPGGGWAISEVDMRALPDSSGARTAALDIKASNRQELERKYQSLDDWDVRWGEYPYKRPEGLIVSTPDKPLDIQGLTVDTIYLWVIRSDGAMVIAPEMDPSRRDRTLKHRDLDPNSEGTEGNPARLAGEFKVVKGHNGQLVLLFDRDSSYIFKRTDWQYLGRQAPRTGLWVREYDWLDEYVPNIFGRYFELPSGSSLEERPKVQEY